MSTPKQKSPRCGEVRAVRFAVPTVILGHKFDKDGPDREEAFVLPADPESVNTLRWQIEQTYLRCQAADITDPWEIAGLVMGNINLTTAKK